MHTLYCKNCGDLYSLKTEENKSCSCGYTSGIMEDGIAKFKGDPLFIEIEDNSFTQAISDHITSNSLESFPFKGKIIGKPSNEFVENAQNY